MDSLPGRGGLGVPKVLQHFFSGFLLLLAFQKCWIMEKLLSVYNIFRGQQYKNVRCFVGFFKMSRFTHKKCSASAQNRGGVQPIQVMPYLDYFFKNGFPYRPSAQHSHWELLQPGWTRNHSSWGTKWRSGRGEVQERMIKKIIIKNHNLQVAHRSPHAPGCTSRPWRWSLPVSQTCCQFCRVSLVSLLCQFLPSWPVLTDHSGPALLGKATGYCPPANSSLSHNSM